ncbi:MAG: hypothetical protein WD469_04305 [Paenibacillaceae bacterium]
MAGWKNGCRKLRGDTIGRRSHSGDRTKFCNIKSAIYPIAQIEQIHCLITDKGVPEEYVDAMKEIGKQVIIAQEEGAPRQ